MTVILFVLPLALDSFAMAAAVGATGLRPRDRWRVTALFVAFEAGMPLIGLALGAPVARTLGGIADYLAAAALVAVGVWMLVGDDDEDERARRLVSSRGLAMLGLGVAVSVDELAIGFGVGLTGASPVAVVVAIAVQAFLAVQVGLALGVRIGERWRERAERLAAAALIALGGFLVVSRLV